VTTTSSAGTAAWAGASAPSCAQRRAPYVVLDFNPEVLEEARERQDYVIEGNCTRGEDLIAAGVERIGALPLPEGGAMIIALRRSDGSFDATPDELDVLEELFAPREAIAS
jgi:hypothetical protein